ncbi:MAG: hypothetical protein NC221_04045 [Duncaniella sp.]|nr:hypothetical protein [Muribaculum sp.]MCM1255272.1 hypothetical protein [Duncaniella sp.]
MKRSSLLALLALAVISLPAMLAQTPKDNNTKPPEAKAAPESRKPVIRPTVPNANPHEPGKVILLHADRLLHNAAIDSGIQILVGNVRIRKEDMFMYCDSARLNEETGSFDAFMNVRMEQGDTLFVYSDELYYDGEQELAELRAYPGKNVRLINRDVSLTTDVFFYDMYEDVGYYQTGGTLTDKQNTLNSLQGYYYPSTKDAFFYMDVDLEGPRENDTLRMYTDSLTYNTETRIAQLMCPTRIINKDGEINSSSGFYDTNQGLADLYNRSLVHTRRGNTLTGDTLFYDREKGFGEAFGNMILTDSANKSAIHGDYGFYDEIKDSSFVTGNALAMEYSEKDTLYLHGDTITAFMLPDSTKVTNAFRRVRFFRNDVQGLCDSLSLVERDSIMYMYYHPVIWNGDKQIVGNVVYVHFNDSTTDWARLPETGIVGQHIGEDCYNQLTGSDMTAWFSDTTLRRLYVEGNVQTIMFPMENDSTYNKFSYTESSFMDALFKNGEVDSIRMWPETTGKVTPLYLAKRASYFLPTFRWFGPLRPMSPDEIFDYPPEMDDLTSLQIFSKVRPDAYTIRGSATGREVPKPKEPDLPTAPAAPTAIPQPETSPLEEAADSLNATVEQLETIEPLQNSESFPSPYKSENSEKSAIPSKSESSENKPLPSKSDNKENTEK